MIKLFSKFSQKKEEVIGIILKEDEGSMMLLSLDSETGIVEKLDDINFTYTNSWERLVQDIDENLFKLEQKNNVKVKKAIFFVYSHLVDQSSGEVKDQYLSKLREVISENGLEPLGFIEHHQAISAYLSKKEEVPLTAVIVEVDSPAIAVFIYKGGEQVFATQVAKTEQVTSDISEAFSKIPKSSVLPARLIIYNSMALDQQATEIISHRFPEELFIQMPKVEIFNAEEIFSALIFAFESQLGHGMSEQANQFISDEKFEEGDKKQEIEVETAVEDEPVDDTPQSVSSAAFGFVVDKDIRENINNQKADVHTMAINNELIINEAQEEEPIVDDYVSPKSDDNSQNFIAMKLTSLKDIFSKFRGGSANSKRNILLLFGFIMLGMSIITVLFFFHKVTLTIFFKSPSIEREIILKDEPKINIVENRVTEKTTIATTGQSDVGEKSKGEVTIYNADLSEVSFKKGVILTASGGKKYILQDEVKVASASTQLTEGGDLLTVTGKKKGNIVAFEIGSEFNLDKNVRLAIENSSPSKHYAITDTLIAGGSKKKIRTVSATDLKRAISAVETKIKKTSIDEDNTQVGMVAIPLLATIERDKETYSAEVDEEATDLTVEITAAVSSYIYPETEMKKLLSGKLKDAVPDGYEIRPEDISYQITDAEADGEIVLTIEAKVKPIYKLDQVAIKKAIAGKKLNQISSIVKDDFDAQGYEIAIENELPILKTIIPFFTQNIEIKTKSL